MCDKNPTSQTAKRQPTFRTKGKRCSRQPTFVTIAGLKLHFFQAEKPRKFGKVFGRKKNFVSLQCFH